MSSLNPQRFEDLDYTIFALGPGKVKKTSTYCLRQCINHQAHKHQDIHLSMLAKKGTFGAKCLACQYYISGYQYATSVLGLNIVTQEKLKKKLAIQAIGRLVSFALHRQLIELSDDHRIIKYLIKDRNLTRKYLNESTYIGVYLNQPEFIKYLAVILAEEKQRLEAMNKNYKVAFDINNQEHQKILFKHFLKKVWIGSKDDKEGMFEMKDMITFENLDERGQVHSHKYRFYNLPRGSKNKGDYIRIINPFAETNEFTAEEKEELSEFKTKHAFFGLSDLSTTGVDRIYACESEMSVMMCKSAYRSYYNKDLNETDDDGLQAFRDFPIISIGGTSGFSSLAALKNNYKFSRCVLIPDADESGLEAIARLLATGLEATKTVFPTWKFKEEKIKDLDDFLQKYTIPEFEKELDNCISEIEFFKMKIDEIVKGFNLKLEADKMECQIKTKEYVTTNVPNRIIKSQLSEYIAEILSMSKDAIEKDIMEKHVEKSNETKLLVSENSYIKWVGKECVTVSNFVFVIINLIENYDIDGKKSITRLGYLHNNKGLRSDIYEFENDIVSSSAAFRLISNTLGAFRWKGTENDLSDALTLAETYNSYETIKKFSGIGLMKEENVFAFRDGIFDLADKRFYPIESDKVARLADGRNFMVPDLGAEIQYPYMMRDNSFYKDGEINWEDIKKFKDNFIEYTTTYNDYKKCLMPMYQMVTGLGWITTCLFMRNIREKDLHFPILFMNGKSGTGKNVFGEMLGRMFGMKYSLAISQTTQAGLQRSLEFFSGLPQVLDEYRNDKFSRDFVSLIKSIFSGSGSVKASMKEVGKIRNTKINSSLLLMGEDRPSGEDGLLARFVYINLSKKYQLESDKFAERIKYLRDKYIGMGLYILAHYNEIWEKFEANYDKMADFLASHKMDSRMLIIHSIVFTGFISLYPEYEEEAYKAIEENVETIKEKTEQGSQLREFFITLNYLFTKNTETDIGDHLNQSFKVYTENISGDTLPVKLAMQFQNAYKLYEKHMANSKKDIYSIDGYKNIFKEEKNILDMNKQINIGGTNKRCIIFNLMDPTCDESIKEFAYTLLNKKVSSDGFGEALPIPDEPF